MSETISFAALRSLNSQFQLLRDILYIRKTQKPKPHFENAQCKMESLAHFNKTISE